jgi:hypothetical protein
MTYFLVIISGLGLFIVGVIADRVWISRSEKKPNKPFNPLPQQLPKLSESHERIIRIYLQEWQVIIETQMHFNELIIKFRSITLTTFGTLIGAAIAVTKLTVLKADDLYLILFIIATLWLTAFILDFFYYHRLLLGAVQQALKFDNAEKLKFFGLFGLTSSISDYVHPPSSKLLILLYYFVPGLIMIFLAWQFT